MIRVTRRDHLKIRDAVRNREPFTNSGKTLRGVTSYEGGGRYFSPYEYSLVESEYVIYSYATPIAWLTSNGWFFNDTKYSVTTTNHQSLIRYALT